MGGRGAGSGGGIESFTVVNSKGLKRRFYRSGKDGVLSASGDGGRINATPVKGASFSRGLANAKKNGTLVKERTKAQTNKREKKYTKDYNDWRAENNRRLNSNGTISAGQYSVRNNGKVVRHRAASRSGEEPITFSEWKRQNGR